MSKTSENTKIFPRILVVNSQSILAKNATGITLRSLWGSWPKNNIMELYCDSRYENVTDFELESIQMGWFNAPLRKIMMSQVSHTLNAGLKEGNQQEERKSPNVKKTVRQVAVCVSDLSPVFIGGELLKKIKEFDADIIYTLGGNVLSLKAAYSLSKALRKPVVIHYMDNWIENFQWEGNQFLHFYRSALNKWHRRCLALSTVGITISQFMADEYSQRLHKPHVALMNSVDSRQLRCERNKSKHKPVFIYAGGLHLNRWKNLRDIAQCIGSKGSLVIYTGKADRELYEKEFSDTCVEFRTYVPHEKIKDVYAEADVLVHTEVADETGNTFFKYSISTKIPEYLATGTNILFYGPENIGLYKYLYTNGVAFCVCDKDELKKTVEKIISNGHDEKMSIRAMELVRRNHELSISQEILRETMLKGIRG